MVSTHGYVAAEPPLGAADTGGQVVYVLELSKELAKLGFEVDIWTRRFADQPEIEPVAGHVRILRVPCGGRTFLPKEYLYKHLPEWSQRVIRFMRSHELQYGFVNSHYWDAGLAARCLCRDLGVPHVHTPHSLGIWKKRQIEADYRDDPGRLEREFNFTERIRSEREIYGSAALVLATSPLQKELLERDYQVPPERCGLLPPGYDARRFFPVSQSRREAIRERLGFRGPVVSAVGRLAFHKGYDLLIDAFESVRRRVPEAALRLDVGGTKSTPAEDQLLRDLRDRAAQRGLHGAVRFGSFIPDPELADYYRAADVFVLSSRYEPFGMTALEAMACGTPAVVTTEGGLHQMVTCGRQALCADPFDCAELGRCIAELLESSSLRARLTVLGAHCARRRFAWDNIAAQLLQLVPQVRYAAATFSHAG